MTAVDIFKASRMKEIEDTTVVSGLVDSSGNLLLSTREGTEINAGNVIGPIGPGFINRGAWTPDTAYAVGDVVASGGSTFVVNVAHTSSSTAPTVETPGPNLSLWAVKGEDGLIGSDGDAAIPAGTISLWAADVAPANWLICDGSAVSRSEYPSLFETVGTKYGAGDGVNTFNLPNLKGRVPVGRDAAQTEFDVLGETGGAKTHTLTEAEMPAHTHGLRLYLGASNAYLDVGNNSMASADAENRGMANTGAATFTKTGVIASTGGGTAHNILQPYSVVNFIIKVTAGETPADSDLAVRLSELEANFSGTPAGTITGWAGSVAPTNWLLCDGSAVSRTTYASLFSAIGVQYGVGNGTTTFNVPNLKGRVPVGRDSAQTEFDVLGETGGAKTHTLTSAEMPAHVHGQVVTANTGPSARKDWSADGGGGTYDQGVNTMSTGGGGAHNNLQPYLVMNYIIKFTNGDTKADSQLTQRVSGIENGTAYGVRIRDKTRLLQQTLSGGGPRKVNADGISWSDRFILMGAGRDDFILSGYFDIQMPPDGTVIPVYNSTVQTTMTVAGGKIPMPTWGALYYNAPMHGTYPSVASRFFFVEYRKDDATFVIPPEAILICVKNMDPFSPLYTWGDGNSQDHWKDLTLLNSWANYDAGNGSANAANPGVYAWAGWRMGDDGKIHLRGLVRSGTNAIITSLNGAFAPDNRHIFGCIANGGFARVDVVLGANTDIYCQGYHSGGNNAWVDLGVVSWFPRDY